MKLSPLIRVLDFMKLYSVLNSQASTDIVKRLHDTTRVVPSTKINKKRRMRKITLMMKGV